MTQDFVIGIDSSTQSTKAIAWARDGADLGEGRAPIAMSNPAEGHLEQEPADWWAACCTALKALGQEVDLSRAQGLAISNQRETIAYLDADGRSLRPATLWLDSRATGSVAPLAEVVGAERLHQITGKPLDVTPACYRLHWMRENEPDLYPRVARFVDVHTFLVGQLTGAFHASWSSADPLGLFDIAAKRWSPDILAALDLTEDHFAPVSPPGTVVGHVTAAAAAATGLPEGLPVVTGGGDGQCAGLGVDATQPGRGYLNLGTAQILGAWGAEPTVSREWRTMMSPTGEGYFYEAVLRAGTFLVDWYVKNFVDPAPTAATYAALEADAARLPVGAEGVRVSPYLSGCMNPHWNMDVGAAILGLRPEHGKANVYRAILEALTGEVARSIRAMRGVGVAIDEIVAVGGGANSVLWREMLGQATGLPLHISNSLEASALGAGMSAAVGIGWFDSFAEAADAMSTMGPAIHPDGSNRAEWDTLLEDQDRWNRVICA